MKTTITSLKELERYDKLENEGALVVTGFKFAKGIADETVMILDITTREEVED